MLGVEDTYVSDSPDRDRKQVPSVSKVTRRRALKHASVASAIALGVAATGVGVASASTHATTARALTSVTANARGNHSSSMPMPPGMPGGIGGDVYGDLGHVHHRHRSERHRVDLRHRYGDHGHQERSERHGWPTLPWATTCTSRSAQQTPRWHPRSISCPPVLAARSRRSTATS
jgi:hypothetical protein